MDVGFLLEGEVVVDDNGDLVDVDTSGKQVSGDENSSGATSELFHDAVSLHLGEVSMDAGDHVASLLHLLSEELDVPLGVAVDDSLGDVDSLVNVKEGLQFPVLLQDDVVLLDTLKGQLFVLDQDFGGVAHEVVSKSDDFLGHGGGEEVDSALGGDEGDDFLHALQESLREHLIGLVEHEGLEVAKLEDALLQHVKHSAGGSDNDVNSIFQVLDVILDLSSSDEDVHFHVQILSEEFVDDGNLLGQFSGGSQHECLHLIDGGVDNLQSSDGKGRGLAGSGLSLGNGVPSFDDGEDRLSLDG